MDGPTWWFLERQAADFLREMGATPYEALTGLHSDDPELVRRARDFYRSVGATRLRRARGGEPRRAV